MGIHELEERTYDSLAVIAYHASASGDPFYTTEAAQRSSYYGSPSYPTMKIDGVLTVTGGEHNGNMYPVYRVRFLQRAQIESPLSIDLDLAYNPDSLKGTVQATIHNTGSSTVSGTLHFVLTQTDIQYSWQGQTMLYHVARDMLPDASGEAVSIAVGDSTIKQRDFAVDPTWIAEDCRIIAFVQASSKEIYQGAAAAVVPATDLTYYGLVPAESSGNGNGIPEPGESFELSTSLKNMGGELATGISGTLSTSDPYISITGASSTYPDVEIGDIAQSSGPFAIDIAPGCPDPHSAQLILDITAAGFSGSDTLPFMVSSQAGFADDMESGQGGWTHAGINDPWHLTEHRSNSPTHSWYSGTEGTWVYDHQIDASLVSPYFVIAPSTELRYQNYYRTEVSYDYGFIELDNGSGWWREFDIIDGIHAYWSEETFDISSYAGQTARVRFRFVSDPGVNEEGWYVDDVSVGVPTGIQEDPANIREGSCTLFSIPSGGGYAIAFSIPQSSIIRLAVYDLMGRRHRLLHEGILRGGSHELFFDTAGTPSGVYFVRLLGSGISLTEKVVVIR